MPEKTRLHLITHTHWDREWYQPFQAFRLRLVHLVDRLLAIFEKDPQFQYFMLDGQTIVLEDYLAIRPEREGLLRGLIQSGRLLIGPWYILPDEFLVSPEAIVRNLLEGQRLCHEFGGEMAVGYIPDPFGHIGQMPQILRGFGIETACFWRGLDEEPCEIIWTASDGSSVLTGYLRESYSNAANMSVDSQADFIADCSRLGSVLAEHSQSHHLLLMNGTDHAEPVPLLSMRLNEAQGQMPDFEIRHSTLPIFFQALQKEIDEKGLQLPRVQGELRACRRSHLLPGVLSSRMWIKQRNHACQNLLERWAEPFNAWAELLYEPDPLTSSYIANRTALIHQAWRLLLQCQPHDSICGCSIDQVHEEMRPRFDQVAQIGEEVTRQCLDMITSQVDLTPPGAMGNAHKAIIVFNPAQWLHSEQVEAVFDLPEGAATFEILDEQGNILPHQKTGSGGQELFRATLDRDGFLNTTGMVKDGNIAGMTIQGMRIERKESRMEIDVTLAEDAQANPLIWTQGMAEIKAYMADPALVIFYVYAHSPSFTRFIFVARDVPGLGYRTFWVRGLLHEKNTDKPVRINPLMKAILPFTGRLLQSPAVGRLVGQLNQRSLRNNADSIENEFLKISIDPKTGTLTVFDKRSGQVYPGLNRFVDGGDRGDTYNTCPPEKDHLVAAQLRQFRILPGDVENVMEIEYTLFTHRALSQNRTSRSPGRVMIPIRSRVSLAQHVARVDIHTELDNQARDHRLRVHFPLPFRVTHAEYDGHFERVNRDLGIPQADGDWIEQPRPEVPQRRFTLVQEGNAGFVMGVRGLPEVETAATDTGCEIRLTLLRCVGWLSRDDLANRKHHAGPGFETPGAQMLGKHVFEYSLIPFVENSQAALQEAQAFDLPFRSITRSIHTGPLPSAQSLLETNSDFELTCLKSAEDGEGIILRGYQPVAGTVTIKTSLPTNTWKQVRMDETELANLPIAETGKCEFALRAWEVATLKWTGK